jgi:hypothetical protein
MGAVRRRRVRLAPFVFLQPSHEFLDGIVISFGHLAIERTEVFRDRLGSLQEPFTLFVEG